MNHRVGITGLTCAHFITTLRLCLLTPTQVWAYVGPGPGITLMGSLFAVALAIVFALGGILIWPLRSFLRRRRAAAKSKNDSDQRSSKNADERGGLQP